MEQQFFPSRGFGPSDGFGSFGFNPLFGGFGAPFFPQRRFLAFFMISPFFFPFRGEDDRDGTYFAQHHCQEEDSYEKLAKLYNVPKPILETMNPQIQHPGVLSPGNVVYIPRLDKMYCYKMHLEQEVPGPQGVSPMHAAQYPMQTLQYPVADMWPKAVYPMHNGQNAGYPYPGLQQYG